MSPSHRQERRALSPPWATLASAEGHQAWWSARSSHSPGRSGSSAGIALSRGFVAVPWSRLHGWRLPEQEVRARPPCAPWETEAAFHGARMEGSCWKCPAVSPLPLALWGSGRLCGEGVMLFPS